MSKQEKVPLNHQGKRRDALFAPPQKIWQMKEGIERKVDGWTDMEMQTVTFVTFRSLLKRYFFSFLYIMHSVKKEFYLRNRNGECTLLHTFTYLFKLFTILQYLTRSAISNCIN
jgi:hypothetical protein